MSKINRTASIEARRIQKETGVKYTEALRQVKDASFYPSNVTFSDSNKRILDAWAEVFYRTPEWDFKADINGPSTMTIECVIDEAANERVTLIAALTDLEYEQAKADAQTDALAYDDPESDEALDDLYPHLDEFIAYFPDCKGSYQDFFLSREFDWQDGKPFIAPAIFGRPDKVNIVGLEHTVDNMSVGSEYILMDRTNPAAALDQIVEFVKAFMHRVSAKGASAESDVDGAEPVDAPTETQF